MEILFDHPKKKPWTIRKMQHNDSNEILYYKYNADPHRSRLQSELPAYTLVWDVKLPVFSAQLELMAVDEGYRSYYVELKDRADEHLFHMKTNGFTDLINAAKAGRAECAGLIFTGRFTFYPTSNNLYIIPYIEIVP